MFTYQFVQNALLIEGEIGKIMQCCMPAYGRKKACNSAGLQPVIKLVIFLQGCRASLPCNTAGQGCRARQQDRQGCRARLMGKAAGQGYRARQGCMAMVQYAESMVKLEINSVF
jgi:hypothetical protein